MAHLAITGQSTDAAVAAVKGENTAAKGRGVVGICTNGTGVFGSGVVGVRAESIDGNAILATAENNDAILGIGKSGASGVVGTSETGSGVRGDTGNGTGVSGSSRNGTGVRGSSVAGRGVEGGSTSAYGVSGDSHTSAGVRGKSVDGRGVEGWSTNSEGVVGISTNGNGVWGQTEGAGVGVLGTSKSNDGVRGVSTNANGVSAFGGHTGIYAKAPVNAGYFEGNIHVTGNITTAGDIILHNADCAEDFDVSGAVKVEPGTVMVLGNEGALFESQQAYDKRVAGVISGAGDYKPGIVLDKRQASGNRQPIALLGKVFCKVDAQFGAIEVGDLLTTSPTPGHAMKTSDPLKAFGAVIGKALRPLTEGQGLIPILIALQ